MRIPPRETILQTAMWQFSMNGLDVPTSVIAARAQVSVGSLFRLFPTKEALYQACYEHASSLLAAPVLAATGQPQSSERLKVQLQRWWLLPAQVALDQSHLFDFWRLYRTRPRTNDRPAPLLGPFEPIPALVAQALKRRSNARERVEPLSLVGAGFAGQWTAAVDFVLSDASCQAQPALGTPVLERAYLGWWHSLGLSEYMEAATPAAGVVAPPQSPPPSIESILLQSVANLLTPSAPAAKLPGQNPQLKK